MTPPVVQAMIEDARHVETSAELSAANINPRTGLATDYLNHFNDALMLLDIVRDMPECAGDFQSWQPMSYVQHFHASQFAARDLVISAYRHADQDRRAAFDNVTRAMTAMLVEVGQAMGAVEDDGRRAELAKRAADGLRPLMIEAGNIISGVADAKISTNRAVVVGAFS